MNMKKKNNNQQLSQYWYAQDKHVKPTHDFYTNQVLTQF